MDLQKMIRRSLLSPLAQAQAQEKASQSLIGSTASTLCCAGKAALLRPIKSHVAFTFYTTMQYTNDINGEITVLRGTNFVTNLGLVTELTHEKWPAGGIEGMQSNAKIFWQLCQPSQGVPAASEKKSQEMREHFLHHVSCLPAPKTPPRQQHLSGFKTDTCESHQAPAAQKRHQSFQTFFSYLLRVAKIRHNSLILFDIASLRKTTQSFDVGFQFSEIKENETFFRCTSNTFQNKLHR